jgi:sulfonate transport system substrate-binding protein
MVRARIGIINKTINMLDFLVADEAGIYRKHGLDVEFDTLAGLRSIRALQAGELDVVVSIGAAVRARMQEQLPLKVLLLIHRNAPHWVMGRAGISGVNDLRGGSIQAGDQGSEPDVMVRRWLSENGLDPEKDVRLTYERAHPGWTEDGPSPVEDAAIARTLEREVLEARGYKVLVELCTAFPNTLVHGLVVMEKTLNEAPDLVSGLVDAHREVSRWIEEGRPEVVSFIHNRWGVSEERAKAAVASLSGVFVARREPEDFGTVIGSSAAALGLPAIEVADLL